ncbi:hypothetical protein BDF14DRAFT_1875644 [Spinellus fusiger]|nr:hypothetical protein BDF14DRAFT_1875644 [Spinellus fusiger]
MSYLYLHVIAQKEIPHSNTDNSTKDLELSQCYADLREQTQKNMDLQNKYNEDIVALSAKSKEKKLRISQSTVEAMEVRYAQLSVAHKTSQEELEKKRVDYKNMETNFYSYLRTVRATDDDLSTIQAEISQISSQLNNFCMTLRSKMDLVAGTAFVFNTWPEKKEILEKTLDTGYITLFVEKYIIETLIQNIFDQPLQLGVSWISQRKDEWSIRLRQQMCMLVSKHAGEEEEQIEEAKKVLADTIISQLASVYPSMVVELNHKKIAVFVSRVTKLNLAMKGQEVPVSPIIINEGIDTFNGQFMNPVNKGKPEGIVLISIFPPFSTSDLKDSSQALVSGKVLCV